MVWKATEMESEQREREPENMFRVSEDPGKVAAESETCFKRIYRTNPSGMLITTLDYGKCIDLNDSFTRITGYGRDEAKGRSSFEMGLWITEEEHRRVLKMLDEFGSYHDMEFNYRNKSGEVRLGLFSSQIIAFKGESCIVTAIQDINQRRQVEDTLKISHSFLKIVNRHSRIHPMLDEFVKTIKAYACCSAVGVRLLDEDGNIPYEACEGFSQRFVEVESPLSIKSDRCMCVDVIKGTTDPELPFCTRGGSFCMNATTRFPATVSDDEKGQTRNMCNTFGYQSVALIPIRLGERILGLIHLADPEENRVSKEKVGQLERAAEQLGSGIERVRKDQKSRESAEIFRKTFQVIPAPAFLWQRQIDGRITLTKLNRAGAGITGAPISDLKGVELDLLWGHQSDIAARIKHTVETGESWQGEIKYRSNINGKVYWLDFYLSAPFKNCALVIAPDITERRESEKKLKRIEWLLIHKPAGNREDNGNISCGDLTDLNRERTIMDLVGKDVLKGIMENDLSLLETSAAIYEKNGDYALGILSSGWCRLLKRASRNLCFTDDYKKAMDSGKWHCHESCWHGASKISIETGRPVDIECRGGIRIYALPIRSGEEIIGSINLGYGDPPDDPGKLQEIADKYHIGADLLKEQADRYESRPAFIIDVARRRLSTSAELIGTIVHQKRVKERVAKSLREKEILLQEIHHRVKNNMQVISNLLELQARGGVDKKSLEVLNDSRSRIHAMSIAHETLHHADNLSAIDVGRYIDRLGGAISQIYGSDAGGIEMNITADEIVLGIEQAIPLGMIINELLCNSFKHAHTSESPAKITIGVTADGPGIVEITVFDDGVGIPENVVWRNAETLGFQLVRGLVEHQLDGTIALNSTMGTCFTIRFPVNGYSKTKEEDA